MAHLAGVPVRVEHRGVARPTGSIRKPAPDERALLISAVENGGTDHAAARAANIDRKTYKRWEAIAADESSTNPARPYLAELFGEIEAAKARARLRREIEVADRYPREWLKHQAPSEPGLPGWTPRIPEEATDEQAALYVPTPEELAKTIRILIESGAVPNPFAVPGEQQASEPLDIRQEEQHETDS